MRFPSYLAGALFALILMLSSGCVRTVYIYKGNEFSKPFFTRTENEDVLGVTYCADNKVLADESIVVIHPGLSPEDSAQVAAHEQIHVKQNKRYGCEKMSRMYSTPLGKLLLEGEAYSKTGMRGEELLLHLHRAHPEIGRLDTQVVRAFLIANGYY